LGPMGRPGIVPVEVAREWHKDGNVPGGYRRPAGWHMLEWCSRSNRGWRRVGALGSWAAPISCTVHDCDAMHEGRCMLRHHLHQTTSTRQQAHHIRPGAARLLPMSSCCCCCCCCCCWTDADATAAAGLPPPASASAPASPAAAAAAAADDVKLVVAVQGRTSTSLCPSWGSTAGAWSPSPSSQRSGPPPPFPRSPAVPSPPY
jgi:hypothetical protein